MSWITVWHRGLTTPVGAGTPRPAGRDTGRGRTLRRTGPQMPCAARGPRHRRAVRRPLSRRRRAARAPRSGHRGAPPCRPNGGRRTAAPAVSPRPAPGGRGTPLRSSPDRGVPAQSRRCPTALPALPAEPPDDRPTKGPGDRTPRPVRPARPAPRAPRPRCAPPRRRPPRPAGGHRGARRRPRPGRRPAHRRTRRSGRWRGSPRRPRRSGKTTCMGPLDCLVWQFSSGFIRRRSPLSDRPIRRLPALEYSRDHRLRP